MLRGILSAVVVLSLGILVLLTVLLTQEAEQKLRAEAKQDLAAAREVVRLANRVNDYSLVYAAEAIADKADVRHAMGCPKDAADATRRTQAEIDPQTGKPIEQDSDDSETGQERVCVDTQHALALRELKKVIAEKTQDWRENEVRFLSDRDLGASVPRTPDLLLAVDANGEIVARAGGDWDSYYGSERQNLNQYEVVGRTERLGAQHDVIMWKDHADVRDMDAMQVAAAPVYANQAGENGKFLGSIVVGYKLNNNQANDMTDLLSSEDLLYFAADPNGRIQFAGNTLDRDPNFRSALNEQEFFEIMADGTISKEARTLEEVAVAGSERVFYFKKDGKLYYVMPATFAKERANSDTVAGFIVLSDVYLETRPLRPLKRWIPIAGIILALITVLLITFLVKLFLRPVDDIGRGVQEVIAGNKNYMWQVDDGYFSDLSHSLNIMSARLQGKPDPDSEDAAGAQEWQGMVGGGAPPSASGQGGKKSIVGLGNLRGRSASTPKDEE